MNHSPKVSVIIPLYNTAAYLAEALDSVCGQDLEEVEIIVIDDGSTDPGPDILDSYLRRDTRIVGRRQCHQGQSVARNRGLSLARGEYVYFMDSDDVLASGALKACCRLCDERQLDLLCFDATHRHSPSGATDADFSYDRTDFIDPDRTWCGRDFLTACLLRDRFFVPPWLHFCRRSFLLEHFGGFPAGIIHEDHLFSVQVLLAAGRVGYLPRPLVVHRLHGGSVMGTPFGMKNVEGYTTVCSRIASLPVADASSRQAVELYLSRTLNPVVRLARRLTLTEKMETWCRLRRLGLAGYVKAGSWVRMALPH